jgi:hypothetical protein
MKYLIALLSIVFSVTVSAAPRIGLGLDGHADYYPSDLADLSKTFRALGSDGNTPYQGILNANGYPSVSGTSLTYANGYPMGTYQVSWTGPGNLNFRSQPGHWVFNKTGTNTGTLTRNGNDMLWMDMSGQIDNLKIISPDVAPGTSFRKPYLDKTKPFSILRFMDWGNTNWSPQTTWESRAKPGQFSYTYGNGTPIELMTEYAKHNGSDLWVNVPLHADENFIRNMARTIKANTSSTQTVKVENSNELWNFGFKQAQDNLHNARSNSILTKPDDFGRAAQQSAERLRTINRIFREEFGGESDRVKASVGGFIAASYWNEVQLDWLASKGENLKQYRLAIAPYAPGNSGDIAEVGGESAAVLFQRIRDWIDGPITTWARDAKRLSDRYGMDAVDAYEANVIGSLNGDVNDQTHFIMQTMAQSKELTTYYFDKMEAELGGDIMQFGFNSTWSKWGHWGLFGGDLNTYSPRYEGVLGAMDAVPEPSVFVLVFAGMTLLSRRR